MTLKKEASPVQYRGESSSPKGKGIEQVIKHAIESQSPDKYSKEKAPLSSRKKQSEPI